MAEQPSHIAQHLANSPADTLQQYLQEKLTVDEKAALDELLAENPLYADALEGLKELPEAEQLSAIRADLHRRTRRLLNRQKGGRDRFQFQQYALAAVAVLVVLFIAATVQFMDFGKKDPAASSTMAETDSDLRFESASPVPAVPADSNFITMNVPEKTAPSVADEVLPGTTTETAPPAPSPARQQEATGKPPREVRVYLNVPNKPTRKLNLPPVVSSTPAQEDDMANAAVAETDEERFADVQLAEEAAYTSDTAMSVGIESGIGLYRKGNYTGAVKLLEQNSGSDIESQLYLGLSHYQLQQYQMAIQNLMPIASKKDTAAWHLAESYRFLGDTLSAQKWYRKLARKKGAYRDAARKQLSP
ncbi:MAG: hypothetical protein AAGI38_11390 [Bacteroidota bacterium]